MSERIGAADLKEWLHDGREIALLDVREHGEYGEAHPFYGVSLPYSRFEAELERLVPRPTARMVVYDDGASGVAERAAERARGLGYTDVRVLEGGTAGWAQQGYRLFAGVNVVSKAFGEIAERAYHTPSISAEELHARLARGEDIVVLDGRPVDEYRKMNIPGSVCCPNGELVYRIRDLVPDAETTVVINCAGRTRSIIGAQTLRNFGIRNNVLALRNGTMGWRLAGLELEHGSNRLYPRVPERTSVGELRRRAVQLAERWAVPRIDAQTVAAWLSEPDRTTYVLDVRTPEEFAEGHLAGAVHAPGGQLVQATDHWLAVRNARVVLVDDTEVRAIMTASWLRQMGWDAVALADGMEAWRTLEGRVPVPYRADGALPRPPEVGPVELAARMRGGSPLLLVDIRASKAYRAAHVAGARWAIRPRADQALPKGSEREPVVLIADEIGKARCFAQELCGMGFAVPELLTGAPEQWTAAGLPVESTPDDPPDAACIDYLFFVHDRHDGNLDAARRYLEWETGLLDQIDARERAAFRPFAQENADAPA